MNITLILFLIGILGFVLNRKNIILMLISIEIMLLSITFLILLSSLNMDDIIGQTYAIYIIVVAGAESAIGLGILVAFYRLRKFYFQNSRKKNTVVPCNFIRSIWPTHNSSIALLNNYAYKDKFSPSAKLWGGFAVRYLSDASHKLPSLDP